jgi:hypothetical protein
LAAALPARVGQANFSPSTDLPASDPRAMPCSSRFDTERGLMMLQGSGTLCYLELLEARARGASHPSFDPSLPCLADFREVTKFEKRVPLIRDMAERPIISRTARLAIVTPPGQPWAMARLFVAYAQLMGRPVEAFTDLEEAERWLGVPSSGQRDAAAR